MDLGLAADDFVITEAEEIQLKTALEDFIAKMKVIYQKMDETQSEIEKSKAEAEKRDIRFSNVMNRMEALIQKSSVA
jgi:multidrug resistance efflux pump